MIDLASALSNQCEELIRAKERLTKLHDILGRPVDLSLGQWFQLYAFGMEFAPDMILELGRGYGNSTCVFTETANRLGNTSVVSLDHDGEQLWKNRTAPSLLPLVGAQWFDCLEVVHQDIMKTDFPKMFHKKKPRRVFLFWDAHGAELARFVLAVIFPELIPRDHIIAVHDITDARYIKLSRAYVSVRQDGLLQTWMDYLSGPFDELVPLYDFLSRNRVPIDTPNNSIEKSLPDGGVRSELQTRLAAIEPTLLETGHWIYFELPRNRPIAFPPSM